MKPALGEEERKELISYRFPQLRSYCNEIEKEEILLSLQSVPRGLVVAGA